MAALLIAGCSGSNSSDSSTSASTDQTGGMQSQGYHGAPPLAVAVPVPKSLKCTDAVVWVNKTRNSYHVAGDPYFGRTQSGEYMCLAAATAAGYHAAGVHHWHSGQAGATPNAMSSGS